MMGTEGNVPALVNGESRHAWQENSRNMVYFTNNSGASRTTGEVVVLDTTLAKSFKTTTTQGDLNVLGVIPQIDDANGVSQTQTILDDAVGYVQYDGAIASVNVDGTTAIGDYLIASATAGKAMPVGYPVRGAFGRATSASAGAGTVSAKLFAVDVAVEPSGSFKPHAGATAPTGYVPCDGSAISRTTYKTLYDAIGTAYGTGDGSTTFNVPDMRGRMAVCKGTHADVDALGDADALALANRTPIHLHTQPTHTHDQNLGLKNLATSASIDVIAAAGGAAQMQTGSTAGTAVYHVQTGVVANGGDNTANTTIPYLVSQHIIKL